MQPFASRRLLLASLGLLYLFSTTTVAAKTASTSAAASSSAAAASTAAASVSDLPSLSTATSSSESASSSSTSASSASSASSSATGTTTTAAGAILTDAPTIAGVGIPTMVVPYTANAPYMQKSTMPEGTVFIAVGAVLAFLGLCVLAWRALVAWSINRSVKRAAMASIMASDSKHPGGWASSPYKSGAGFYSQPAAGSSTSLHDHGTVRRNAAFRNPVPSNASGLFFSPTASSTAATTSIPMTGLNHNGNRASSLLPAGYYAAPSSQIAGGAGQTSVGGGYSDSPSIQARRGSQMPSLSLGAPRGRNDNRYSARASSLSPAPTPLHQQTSASSLQANTGHDDMPLPGSRAPSAYLEDLFEGHGNPGVPRSRGGEY